MYAPNLGKFNFAILSTSVLSKSSDSLPSKIKPGVIKETLCMVNKEKEHHLAVDGKTYNSRPIRVKSWRCQFVGT